MTATTSPAPVFQVREDEPGSWAWQIRSSTGAVVAGGGDHPTRQAAAMAAYTARQAMVRAVVESRP